MGAGGQRGFVRSSVMDLAFLFLLIVCGILAWKALDTLLSGEFALSFFMAWLIASAIAWWWTRQQPLLLRVPVGFLLYLGLSSVLLPLAWWSQSRLAVAAEAAVAVVLASYVGAWLTRLIEPKVRVAPPWYLDQRINLIADLARWVFVAGIAWFVVGVLPLLLVFLLPVEWITWAALAWACVTLAWYLYKSRPGRMRVLKVPLGLWVFVAAAVLLKLLQPQLIGPLEAGSIAEIGYLVYASLVAALFAEIVVLGTPRP
ncbi:MAG TPA: hypothetical protein VF651_03070 [Gammaproteobacteria bacterium]